MCVCMYIYIYMCVYVYIYIYTYKKAHLVFSLDVRWVSLAIYMFIIVGILLFVCLLHCKHHGR